MVGIYCIECKINNKKYIGKSENLEHRLKSINKCILENVQPTWVVRNSYLTNAINKYGITNFKVTILEECSQESLNDREKYYISFYNTYDRAFGYNMTLGGEGVSGLVMSEESKKKMSESAHTRRPSESRNKSISNYMKLNNPMYNPEIAKKNADARRGKELSESHRKNIGLAAKGRPAWNRGVKTGPQPEEVVRKRAESMIGHEVSDSCRKKIRESKVGKISITKDNKVKYIHLEELPRYEELGYSRSPRVYGERSYNLVCKSCGQEFKSRATTVKLCPECKNK